MSSDNDESNFDDFKIIIRNIAKDIKKSDIENIFSDKKRFGRYTNIKDIIIKSENNSNKNYVIIEFNNEETVEAILIEPNIEIMGKNYNVKKFDKNEKLPNNKPESKLKTNIEQQQSLKTSDKDLYVENGVLVKNVDENDIDTVKLLYENQRKSGGGSIKEVFYISGKKNLIIYYDNPDDAFNVIQRKNTEFKGKTYTALRLEKNHLSEKIDDTDRNNEEYEIVVNNVSVDDVEDVLLIYENEKKSGGGPIRKHNYIRGEKTLKIEFENYDCVARVISFGEIEHKKKIFKAKRAKETLLGSLSKCNDFKKTDSIDDFFDNNKFKLKFFSNEKSNLEDKSIKLYIESLLKHVDFSYYKLDYGIDYFKNGCLIYLVVSNQRIDFDVLNENYQKKKKFLERNVGIERIKNTCYILVESEKHADEDEIYFSSSNQSGGGEVKSFKKIKKYCLIEFYDKKDIERVLSRKHEDRKVYPYYEDINIFEQQFNSNIKVCPFCTLHCDLNSNFCDGCNYQFKKSLDKNEEKPLDKNDYKNNNNINNKPHAIETETINEDLGIKTCPKCTLVCNIKNNFCSACNYKYNINTNQTGVNETDAKIKKKEKMDVDDNVKECPDCTTICEKRINFCPTCNYKFNNETNANNNNEIKNECPRCEKPCQPHHKFCINCGFELLIANEINNKDLMTDDEDDNDKNKIEKNKDFNECPRCTAHNKLSQNFCEACDFKLN